MGAYWECNDFSKLYVHFNFTVHAFTVRCRFHNCTCARLLYDIDTFVIDFVEIIRILSTLSEPPTSNGWVGRSHSHSEC